MSLTFSFSILNKVFADKFTCKILPSEALYIMTASGVDSVIVFEIIGNSINSSIDNNNKYVIKSEFIK